MVYFTVFVFLSGIVSLSGSGDLKNKAEDGDYIGCFARGCLTFDHHVNISADIVTTPDSCTASCKELGFSLAGVYNRSRCSCSCQQTCLQIPLPDRNCGVPCRHDSGVLCGSYIAVAVYTVPIYSFNEVCGNLEEPPMNPELSGIPIRGTGEPADNQQSLAIPITVPVVICVVAILAAIVARFLYKRNRRDSTLATPHPNLQNKDQSTKVAKQNQGLNMPPTHALPSPPDPYVINQPHNSSTEDHSYHVYAEADQDKRLAQNPSDLNIQPSDPHIMSTDDCTPSEVHHEYLDMLEEKQVESKSDTPDGTGTKDEDGYITPDVSLPTPSAPAQSTQVVYYSSKLPNTFRGDEGMSPQSPTSDGICVKDEEGYITPDVSLPTSPPPAQKTQVVYYSSRLPKHIQEDESMSSKSPSPIVYYASAIRKSDKN